MLLSPGPNHPSLLHLHQARPTFHILFLLLWIGQLDIFWQWHLKFTVIEIVTKLFSIGSVHVESDVKMFNVGQQFCEAEAIFVKEMSWWRLQYLSISFFYQIVSKQNLKKTKTWPNWTKFEKLWQNVATH